VNLAHLVYSLDEITPYEGEGSWDGRRLVAFGLGTTATSGVCGYCHAIELRVRPGHRILPHWHGDREAVYYCLGGRGRFWLDETLREVGPGDAMFQTLYALHGADNPGGEDLRFVDVAMFTDRASPVAPGERCFTSIDRAPATEHRGATLKTLFPPEMYGNDRIEWCGELHLAAGRALERTAYPTSEQLLLALSGEGTVEIDGAEAPVRPGTVLYLPAGFPHSIGATAPLRLFGARSRIGRVQRPRLLDRDDRPALRPEERAR
jgi:mannose-6-phosphate isomerase-like protein (cupin superfamily)